MKHAGIELEPEQALALVSPLVKGGRTRLEAHLREETAVPSRESPQPHRSSVGAVIEADGWYAIADVAKILPWSPRTLEAWRSAGKGPAYSRAGGRILYRGADLIRFLEGCRRLDAQERRAARRALK